MVHGVLDCRSVKGTGHTHTHRLPCLFKPGPAQSPQSRLAQHSHRANALRQAVKVHAGGQIAILHSPPGRLTVAAGPAKAWGRAYFLFVLHLKWSSVLPSQQPQPGCVSCRTRSTTQTPLLCRSQVTTPTQHAVKLVNKDSKMIQDLGHSFWLKYRFWIVPLKLI